jgi:hypothetical protein
VVTSATLFDELAGVINYDRHLYRRIVTFLFAMSGRRMLIPQNERVKREVLIHGAIGRNGRYFTTAGRTEMRRILLQTPIARDVASGVAALVAPFKADMEARRDSIRQRLGTNFATNTNDWWESAAAQIDDWTNDYLQGSKDLLQLPDDRTQWPTPAQVPTARLRHAFYMARIALNVGQNRRIDASDYYDAMHYSEGAYFDLMITDDQRFTETYSIVPRSHRPFMIETFREFAEKRLGIYGLP